MKFLNKLYSSRTCVWLSFSSSSSLLLDSENTSSSLEPVATATPCDCDVSLTATRAGLWLRPNSRVLLLSPPRRVRHWTWASGERTERTLQASKSHRLSSPVWIKRHELSLYFHLSVNTHSSIICLWTPCSTHHYPLPMCSNIVAPLHFSKLVEWHLQLTTSRINYTCRGWLSSSQMYLTLG